mgnify:CR=1 FL=1
MSRFAHLFTGLMAWSFDGWWSLTQPMTEREWKRYYVDLDESDDIIAQERPEEVEVNVDDQALAKRIKARGPPKAGFNRAMEIGRARLGME